MVHVSYVLEKIVHFVVVRFPEVKFVNCFVCILIFSLFFFFVCLFYQLLRGVFKKKSECVIDLFISSLSSQVLLCVF